jgi:exosortase
MASVDTPPIPARGPAARWLDNPSRHGALATGCLAVALLWSYWPTLEAMADRWWSDPQYSHGFLVPVFAAAVLWSRRALWAAAPWRPSPLGLPVLLAGLGLRLVAAAADIEPLDAFSLLPTLLGLVLLAGGTGMLRWSWPAIAFLGFMLPLPFSFETTLAQPLRRLATVVSTYALQTLGCPAFSEGNVILVGETRLGVAEACSGLGMLLTFFAMSTAFALVVRRPLADRLVLVASAVPVAVAANVARITATGLAYHAWGADSAAARAILHDLAGWLMMPLALALLWVELVLLGRLFVEVPLSRPLPLFNPRSGPAR